MGSHCEVGRQHSPAFPHPANEQTFLPHSFIQGPLSLLTTGLLLVNVTKVQTKNFRVGICVKTYCRGQGYRPVWKLLQSSQRPIKVVRSSQSLDAFEGRSQACHIAALPMTSLASQISLWHPLSLWFMLVVFFNWRAPFLGATRQAGAWTDEGKSIPGPGNTMQRACLPDKD